MKLMNLILLENEVMAHFGEAKIVKTMKGRHKLIGGTEQDRNDALDWMVLFCPEITLEIEPGYRGTVGLRVPLNSGRV